MAARDDLRARRPARHNRRLLIELCSPAAASERHIVTVMLKCRDSHLVKIEFKTYFDTVNYALQDGFFGFLKFRSNTTLFTKNHLSQ